MSSNSYLILQDLVKKELLNSKNLENQNTLPIKKINLHEQPTRNAATQEEIKEAEEMYENVISWADTLMIGLDILAIAAAVYTGGLAGAAYIAGRKAIKVSLLWGLRRYGRKVALRKFKKIAVVMGRRANPKRVARRIRDSLAQSKLKTAVSATKYYIIGDMLTDWQHTKDVGNIIVANYTAMMEQHRAKLVAGNKARVAVAANFIDGSDEVGEFIKSFFTLHTNYEAFDAPSRAQEFEYELEDGYYSEYRDPQLWKLDVQILNLLTSDKIVNIFNSAFDNFNEMFSASNVSDKYGSNRKNIIQFQKGSRDIIASKYFEIFRYLREESGGVLAVLGDVVSGGIPADYLVVDEGFARQLSYFWADTLMSIFEDANDSSSLGIAHPQFFAICCLKLYKYGITSEINFNVPFRNVAEPGITNKVYPFQQLLNAYPSSFYNQDGEIFNFNDLTTVPFDQDPEKQNDPYAEDDYSAYEAGKVYDDLPAGVEEEDPRFGTVTHSPGAMLSAGLPSELEELVIKVENIFQGKEKTLKKKLEDMSYEIFEDYSEGQDEDFLKIFQNFALTVLLDPSGQGFGGYEKVAQCTEWFSKESQSGFKEVTKKIGMYPQLLGNLIFYYPEIYVINKPFAAIYKKIFDMKKAPKILRIGTTQNMLLVLTGFLALAFLDPLNSIDKKRLLKILLEGKKLAYRYASEAAGTPIALKKCPKGNSFGQEEKKRSKKDQAEFYRNMTPTAVPSGGGGLVKEQDNENLSWELTEEQNKEVMAHFYRSFEELEREINQTISELFEWSAQVQRRQQVSKKQDQQKPGASPECEIFLARKEIRNNMSNLQGLLRSEFEEKTGDSKTFRINSRNFDDVNCLFDEFAVEIERVFDSFKLPDTSPFLGDHSIDENKTSYLEKYILENNSILETPEGILLDPSGQPLGLPTKAPKPSFQSTLGKTMDLDTYYQFLIKKMKVNNSDAWIICTLLDFAGYHQISNPSHSEGSNTEWFSWENVTSRLKGPSNIDLDDISASMKANYTKLRYKFLRPRNGSVNYANWSKQIDHRFGSYARGKIDNLFHLRYPGGGALLNFSSYNIVGISRPLGYDNNFIQSNVHGSIIREATPLFVYDIIDNLNGNIGYLTLGPDYANTSTFERNLDSNLMKNTHAAEVAPEIVNSSDFTGASTIAARHEQQVNILTSCHEYVLSKVKQGLWVEDEKNSLESKLDEIFPNISGSEAVLSPKEKKHILSIIKICKNVAELYLEWNETVKAINDSAQTARNSSLGKGNIERFEQFAKELNNRKSLSKRWFLQEKEQIQNEQIVIDKYIKNIVKLIKIDEKVANSIN